ncbi:MAG: mechanosensitive ion channel family protein [Candidatus Methanoperedens sp.]|nr:mechanosensitive ion channel family protein [Candidatus Methanoperedens sp.]
MLENILTGDVTLENLLIFVFIFIVTLIAGNLLYALARNLLDEKLSLGNSKLIARVTQYMVFILGFSFGLYFVLQSKLTALVASLGIIGIAVAFASQQLIQNIIAGIMISIGRPIRLDDWVEIGGSGISNIRDITLMRTILRDKNGRLFYIPNSVMMSSIIINYTKSGFVEVPVPLRVSFGSDLEKIRKIVFEVANEHADILPNVSWKEKNIITKLFELPGIKMLFENKMNMSIFEPKTLVSDISDSGATLSIRIWMRKIEKKDEIISGFLEELLKRFKQENIGLK